MKRAVCIFGLLLSATSLLAANIATGTWRLDLGKSKSSWLPREETLRIEDLGSDMLVTIQGTSHDGSPILLKFTEPWKGGKGAVQAGHLDAVSGRRTSDSSYNTTYWKAGKPVQTNHAVVLGNGKIMRVIVQGTDAQGRSISGIEVFLRE